MLTELALQTPGTKGDIKAPGDIPTGGFNTTGQDALTTGLQVAFVVAIITCLFFIIWGGMQWISSSGDQQKLAAARARIMYAIIGLVIVLLSFFIVNLFTSFLGINGAKLDSSEGPGMKDTKNRNRNRNRNNNNNGNRNNGNRNNGGKKASFGNTFTYNYSLNRFVLGY